MDFEHCCETLKGESRTFFERSTENRQCPAETADERIRKGRESFKTDSNQIGR